MDSPNPRRIPGEADAAFAHYRAFARSGGHRPDGSYQARPKYAVFARSRGVNPTYVRQLASKHKWPARTVEYDNLCGEFMDRKVIRKRDWTETFHRVSTELETRDLSEFSAGDLTGLARLCAAELKAEREAEAKTPAMVSGITPEALAKLSPKDQVELRRILEVASAGQ